MQMLPLRTATSTTGGARMDKDQGKREMEEQLEMVTKAFVDHYYNLFDTNRAALACLYDQTSMLSFEGQKILGADEIGRKLSQLPFEQCNHSISTVDCQPSPFVGGILVFVTGNLQLAGEEHQLRFSQIFQLIPTQQASFFVQNDIFRLNYC
ncbi:hypothetical protein C4D60_Mb09t10880 [Musa balbisiana]|uniref:NTF2 domain-containing protein n=1 Tax=Musa balbisiana TaxID=52838 RepID=A0A4S8IGA3_MUSBA|nr:hypothetical protein C4D60_Mb09t10880 [Musa balbisiana]